MYTCTDGTNAAAYNYVGHQPLVGQINYTQSGTPVMMTSNMWDNLKRLTGVQALTNTWQTMSSFQYAYNPAGQRIAVTNEYGGFWVYQYDTLGQVVSGNRYWSNGAPVMGQQFTYSFDTIGNRKLTGRGGDSMGIGLRQADYSANLLNQYTSREVPGAVDIVGRANSNATVTVNNQRAFRQGDYFWTPLAVTNRSTAVWVSVTNIGVLTNGTNPDFVATNVGDVFLAQTPETYGYDWDGNLINDGRWTYQWDAENRLTNMTSLSSAPAGSKLKLDFAYDYTGRRIQKTVSTNNGTNYVGSYTNCYAYDRRNCIGILNASLALLNSFQWGLDLSGSIQGAGGVGGLISMTVYSGTNAGTYFYSYDGNGNVMELLNANNQTAAAKYEYGPFGEVIRATGPMAKLNPFRFSTKDDDDETDFLYYGYRYYNPNTGRWIGQDPAGEDEGGPNLYAILCNDPIDDVDYIGLVDYKFEITEGGWGGWAGAAGRWGQPWWCASGMALNHGAQAISSVTIKSRNNLGGSCNSVDKPDPAGTIKLYLKNCSPGGFQVSINYMVQLSGTGPQGNSGPIATLNGGGRSIVNARGAPFIDTDLADFTAYVGTGWTLVAQYTPTISLHIDRGVKSTSTAYGMIQFISAGPQ